MSDPTVTELLTLIRDIDLGATTCGSKLDAAGIEYLVVTRWNGPEGSGGNDDERATEILRALVREKLGTFPVAAIGSATLEALDSLAAGSGGHTE